MRKTTIATLLAATILTGCQVTTVEPRKTNEQIKAESAAESRQWLINNMRAEGKTQEDIDRTLAYIDLPYKKQLESKIASYRTPAGNLLNLLDSSYSKCNQIKGFTQRSVTRESLRETEQDLFKCAIDSLSVVTSFYYKSYHNKNQNTKENELVIDAYVKWSSYMEEITRNPKSHLIDQLAVDANAAIQKAEISVETYTKKK